MSAAIHPSRGDLVVMKFLCTLTAGAAANPAKLLSLSIPHGVTNEGNYEKNSWRSILFLTTSCGSITLSKYKISLFKNCMCMNVLSACLPVLSMHPSAHGGQKRGSDLLVLELQTFMSCCVDAGHQTWMLWKSGRGSYP